MMGGSLPASMMAGSHDMGEVMGQLFADAPGPRVSPAQEAQLATGIPAGAVVDKASNTVTFAGQSVDFSVVASPSMPAENFTVAGLTNPTIVVPEGAQVQVEVVNADPDMAHGFVVATQGAQSSAMPMMTATPAFGGSSLWFLGDPTSAGMHAGTVSFTASAAGTYSYFCPVPHHAQEGMVGSFVVQPPSAS
jgi:rusticyanin